MLKDSDLDFNYSATNLQTVKIETGGTSSGVDVFFDTLRWYKSLGTYTSQTIDVGAGVVWGQITWSETADGATIVVEVNTSPDDADWTETKQTVSSGDYITGNNRYLRYYIDVTSGTENTEIDDINITYEV